MYFIFISLLVLLVLTREIFKLSPVLCNVIIRVIQITYYNNITIAEH